MESLEVSLSLNRQRLVVPLQALRSNPGLYYLKEIPGVKAKGDSLYLPAEPRMFELLDKIVRSQYHLQGDAKRWYEGVIRQEHLRAQTSMWTDTTVDHTQAHRLYPFQRVDAKFMLENKRTLLCNETGMGKSASVIVSVEASTEKPQNVLLLCPKPLMVWWGDEIRKWSKFGEKACVTLLRSETREIDLYEFNLRGGWLILNWQQLRFVWSKLMKHRWRWIVFDEAHKLKNRKTKIYQAMSGLISPNMIFMTGTPFSNNASELWSLLHLLEPSKFPSFWRFYEMYVDYEVSYGQYRKIVGTRNPGLLARELRSRMLRRYKKDFLKDLPEKLYQTIPTEMHPKQFAAYKQMAEEMILTLEDEEPIEVVNTIGLMVRLRQLLSTTATLIPNTDFSGKLDAAVEIISGSTGKVVVFTMFRATVFALCARLLKQKIPYVLLVGGMSPGEIEGTRKKFQEDPEIKAFICTLEAGGEAITLTAASMVLFVDKHYNPGKQKQAEDRIHRPGQLNVCHIVDLYDPKSIDVLVEKILAQKVQMINAVLEHELLTHLRSVK